MAPKRKKEEEDSDVDVDVNSEEEVAKPKKERKKSTTTKEKANSKSKPTEPFTDDLDWNIVPPSLLYRDWDSKPSSKIAAFDLDGTLVNVKSRQMFPINASDWKWYNKKVEKTIKGLVEDGYKIVIFSNQGGVKSALTGTMATKVKERINQIVDKLSVPVQVFCATMEDKFRKPEAGMWEFFVANCNGNQAADQDSFFVGDAAGRPSDFADSDKVFAERIGLSLRTPEDVFGEMDGKRNITQPPSSSSVAAGGSGDQKSGEGCANPDLVEVFSRLAEQNSKNGKGFQAAAFLKVSLVLKEFPKKIDQADLKEVAKLKGVGKGSLAVIQEFLTSGRIEALDGPADSIKEDEGNDGGVEGGKKDGVKAKVEQKAKAVKSQIDKERDMALSFM